MRSEAEIRQLLRDWITKHAKAAAQHLRDDTQIVKEGILSSLDIVEFVLFIESLRGAEVDADAIEPSVFRSIDTVYGAFFAETRLRADAA
jgi:acyl carrier protein